MAVIVPGKGESREVAKQLLLLADDANQVATTMDGPDGVSFVVPDELYDKYLTDSVPAPTSVGALADEDKKTEDQPKRRGRPPGSRNKPKDSEE